MVHLRSRDPHAGIDLKPEHVKYRAIAWGLLHGAASIFYSFANGRAWTNVRSVEGNQADSLNGLKSELLRALQMSHIISAGLNAVCAYAVARQADQVHSVYGCITALNILGTM